MHSNDHHVFSPTSTDVWLILTLVFGPTSPEVGLLLTLGRYSYPIEVACQFLGDVGFPPGR